MLLKIYSLRGTTKSVFNVEDETEYNKHSGIVIQIAERLLLKEKRKLEIDEHNFKLLQFLLHYFNESSKSELVFPDETYMNHKQIMLMGNVGVGKTFIMDVFAEYLRIVNNSNAFETISITELIDYYKLHNHLDEYTYNKSNFKQNERTTAKNICLNDLGLKTYLHFGVDTKSFIDDFLYARYELYCKYDVKTHITTNLSVAELEKSFNFRLVDRFKAYNVIDLGGESRRK